MTVKMLETFRTHVFQDVKRNDQLDLEDLSNVPVPAAHDAETRQVHLQVGYKPPIFSTETHASNNRSGREENAPDQHFVAKINLHEVVVSNSTA